MALVYSIWSRRDARWPSSAAPLDFLTQPELRCSRRVEMLRGMAQFAAAEVIISLFLFWLASSLVTDVVARWLVVMFGTAMVGTAKRARARGNRPAATRARWRRLSCP